MPRPVMILSLFSGFAHTFQHLFSLSAGGLDIPFLFFNHIIYLEKNQPTIVLLFVSLVRGHNQSLEVH